MAYLRKIPRGSVKTYAQVEAIENPLQCAVANAIGKTLMRPKFLATELLIRWIAWRLFGQGRRKNKEIFTKKENYKTLKLLFDGRSGLFAYFPLFLPTHQSVVL